MHHDEADARRELAEQGREFLGVVQTYVEERGKCEHCEDDSGPHRECNSNVAAATALPLVVVEKVAHPRLAHEVFLVTDGTQRAAVAGSAVRVRCSALAQLAQGV
eukprot:scaffold69739_cov30-Tisochrysis_lutea.AAC.4